MNTDRNPFLGLRKLMNQFLINFVYNLDCGQFLGFSGGFC